MDLSKEKATAILAAKEACTVLNHYYGKNKKIKVKPNKSLVGIADIEANKAIIKVIKKNFPKHNILSEESTFEDNNSDFKWVIDPLDGTHNFLHELPIYGTSIALEYKEQVVLGILQFPALGITAIAEKGKGAFFNGKKMKVSSKNDMEHSFILFEFSYANRKEKADFLEKLIHKTIDVRNFGAAIYHLFLVACGRCDGYVILSTNEWDVAAGFLMVEEAGGKITDLLGNKYSLQEHKFVVSNGKIHNKLLDYLKLK